MITIMFLLAGFILPQTNSSFDEWRITEAIISRALQCDRIRQPPDEELLRSMLEMEKKVGVPVRLRGLSLAAACHEAGFNPEKEGDHKFSESGKPLAIGILQQWPWVSTSPWGPKIDRRDPYAAVWAWLEHWESKLVKVDAHCRFGPDDDERRWVAAQVTSVRKPMPGRKARCRQESKHYARFKRWRKAWEALLPAG